MSDYGTSHCHLAVRPESVPGLLAQCDRQAANEAQELAVQILLRSARLGAFRSDLPLDESYLIRSELSLMDRFAPEIGALGDWLVRAEWIGRFLDRAQTLGRYAVGPIPCLKNSNLFSKLSKNDR